MNILLINRQLQPEISGIATHFDNIAKTLLALGHEVTRVVAKDPSFVPKNNQINYYYFSFIEKRSCLTASAKTKRKDKNHASLKKTLARVPWRKIDAVIASNDIYLPFLKGRVSSSKIISIIPSSLAFSSASNPLNYKKVTRRMQKNLLDVKVVVLSKKMRTMLATALGKNYSISTIYPGVWLDRFSAKNKKRLPHSLLYVGRLDREKNTEALIRAVALLRNNFSLDIIGAGDKLNFLKKLTKELAIEKNVFFRGRKKRVEKYYSQSQIFILPSRFEAFGLVLLEAMAAGLPIIAFRPSSTFITASDEIIDNASDGFLVDNIPGMAQRIDLLLENNQLREKMSQAARKKAEAFTWENHVKKLLTLL
ncbi:MAG: glycosyltransferase family 4 protein [Candidatus Moraniibacteriota bacterium]